MYRHLRYPISYEYHESNITLVPEYRDRVCTGLSLLNPDLVPWLTDSMSVRFVNVFLLICNCIMRPCDCRVSDVLDLNIPTRHLNLVTVAQYRNDIAKLFHCSSCSVLNDPSLSLTWS